VQVSYLNHYISPQFIKGGGTENWLRVSANLMLKHDVALEFGVQPERVVMPLLTGSRSPQYDVSGWAGVRYTPAHKVEN
jgi:hypothetical protein